MVKNDSRKTEWQNQGDYLLDFNAFVQEEKQRFVDPQRKGVAKGEPIGFSRDKYMATIYRAMGHSLKEIAKYLGISYGTLRNWGMDQDFKDMVERKRKEIIAQASGPLTTNISKINWATDLAARRKKEVARDLFLSSLDLPVMNSSFTCYATDPGYLREGIKVLQVAVFELKEIIKKPKLTKKDKGDALRIIDYLEKTFGEK